FAGEQHRITAARGDLDRGTVVVDLLDEREQVLAGLAGRDRHWQPPGQLVLDIVPVGAARQVALISEIGRQANDGGPHRWPRLLAGEDGGGGRVGRRVGGGGWAFVEALRVVEGDGAPEVPAVAGLISGGRTLRT